MARRDYRRCLDHWNAVFAAEDPIPPRSPDTGNAGLDRGLDWLCENAQRVLDFGCGNGVLLLLCALRGAKELWGVDLSPAALTNARGRFDRAGISVNLQAGGVEALEQLASDSFDAVLLSNILDNLYPEDALELLAQCRRLLRPGGHPDQAQPLAVPGADPGLEHSGSGGKSAGRRAAALEQHRRTVAGADRASFLHTPGSAAGFPGIRPDQPAHSGGKDLNAPANRQHLTHTYCVRCFLWFGS